MHAIANVLTPNQPPYVKLSHNGEEISFQISVFNRKNFEGENIGTLDRINEYWKQLPEEKQSKIFEVYKAVEYATDSIFNQKELTDFLTDRVAELITLHDYNAVLYWVQNKSDIQIPSSFEADYEHSFDNNTSREKTYTRSDYIKLVALSVLLRCMIPIWGEFIFHIRKSAGTKFKEYSAFRLLGKSNIIHSEPMEKLKAYVENIVGEDKLNPNHVHSGVSSEDFCYWLVGLICIRRLSVGNVNGHDPKVHLVSFIYKFIIRHVQGTDTNSEDAIREKRDETDKDSNGFSDKISTLERYKFKFNISPGIKAELEFSMRDLKTAATKISYRVDPEFLDRSIATAQELANQTVMMPQINLMRWLFRPIISPRGMMYIPDHTVYSALGAAQALLWTLGFKYLAILVTSYPVLNERALELRVSNSDAKQVIPEDLLEKINTLYPYHRSIRPKKNDPNNEVKFLNLTIKTISDMVDSLRLHSWKPTCEEWMLVEVFGVNNRRTPIRSELRLELTKLVAMIGERSWT